MPLPPTYQYKFVRDAVNNKIMLHVVDTANADLEHPEFGKVAIDLNDITFGDLPSMNEVKLRKFGVGNDGTPLYILASSTGFPSVFPFKIYNIGNQSASDVQKAAYVAAGADINYFTYQVRSGVVGFRSQYNFVPSGAVSGTFGVFEEGLNCLCTDDTQFFESSPVANTGLSIALSNVADVLIYDDKIGGPLPQILIDPTYDSAFVILASFYLKLIDDPAGTPYSQLWGRMFTGAISDPTGRPTTPLPSVTDSSIIPLGFVYLIKNIPANSGVYQYQWGNLVNRYASESPLSSPLGPVNIQRGYWSAGADNLSGQFFYKGDVVVDDTVLLGSCASVGGSTANVFFYGVYTFIGTVSPQVNSPATEPGSWRQTGTLCTTVEL